MNELAKSVSDLVNTINSGANGLGQTMRTVAPEAWKCAVYQAQLEGWIGIACFGLAFALTAWGSLRLLKMFKDDGDEGFVVFAIIVAIISFVSLATTVTYIPQLINPEYEAASQIAKRLLGK